MSAPGLENIAYRSRVSVGRMEKVQHFGVLGAMVNISLLLLSCLSFVNPTRNRSAPVFLRSFGRSAFVDAILQYRFNTLVRISTRKMLTSSRSMLSHIIIPVAVQDLSRYGGDACVGFRLEMMLESSTQHVHKTWSLSDLIPSPTAIRSVERIAGVGNGNQT